MFKITHITMFVHDQDATLNFYKNLGFTVHTDANFDGMRWLTLCFPDQRDFELVVMKATTDIEKSLVGKQGGDMNPFITFQSNDCTKDYEILRAQGIEVLDKPETQPWGVSMMFKDNSGNKIYVCQPV
jgi:catechol 2,3-dioxygenase-like lactoylglutathione lyase family enzyme